MAIGRSSSSSSAAKAAVKKALGEMGFTSSGGAINWFPGHMAAATRAIRDRLKVSDLVIEVRDSRIPLSSVNADLQPHLSKKRRVIALNKKDLANPNVMHLLDLVEVKLKEVISREPTLLVMVVGVPNVGKSALINSIHRIASSRFPVQEKIKRATVGPLPGVTQDVAGFKIAHHPSIYVLDTPGVLVPSIPDIETGLKLALAGSVKDSVVGEERIAQYLLALLNTRGTPLHWKHSNNRRMEGIRYEPEEKHDYNLKDLRPKKKPPNVSDVLYIEDMVTEVQWALYFSALRIPHKASEARIMVSKKFLTLFRTGKLGSFILDDVPEVNTAS
ncbi:hypothetical protein EUGRSUZ_L01356 [Eucalyptus grandis]|uniref:G domain-containing protein n=1 Tax=Eucalyptus grandis TaxID=71139 RepID=A0A058ZTD6_EUCGR|nr:hypothetical protein EUGRSUZ_L01356 [Eucalyptus grandis]